MSKIPKNTKTPCIIYTLADPESGEIRYIGKTVKTLKARLTDHLYSIKRESNYRSNWIKSIINRDLIPIIEELEICTWDISQQREMYWISQFKVWGFKLVNLTEGGEGCIGRKYNLKTIDKIKKSSSKKVYQYSLDGNFIKEWKSSTEAGKSLGKTNSKICSCARGKRNKAYGFIWNYKKLKKVEPYKKIVIISENQKENLKLINSKPVLQYDKNNNFIREWESAKKAAKELGLNYIAIINYINGKRINHRNKNKTGEYIWKRKKI